MRILDNYRFVFVNTITLSNHYFIFFLQREDKNIASTKPNDLEEIFNIHNNDTAKLPIISDFLPELLDGILKIRLCQPLERESEREIEYSCNSKSKKKVFLFGKNQKEKEFKETN